MFGYIARNKTNIFLFTIAIIVICITTFANRNTIADNNGNTTIYLNGSLANKSLETLETESILIIQGIIKETPRNLAIQAVFGGDPIIHTDYTVIPNSIFRGNEKVLDDNEITIRIMGGTVKKLHMVAESEPKLKPGNEYILFLTKPGMGSGYNTEGDYYYVNGAIQGTFEKVDEDKFISQSDGEAVIYPSKFSQKMKKINEQYPVDENIVKDTFLENLDRNYSSGFITEEEYKQFLAELDEYATIVNMEWEA